ncbi:MAG: hypothetical protein CL943_03050 [Candidatus Diapherotrites archaeon]|uniref:DUF2226 domain-containing protein n=1 Tax=Candidatus Iainarchaeum sp. TaxID=3101447 RepID=A0A2D6M1G3_9ARCH|nr:hypothetical protein [Candidatus Diapherotrites archaeon]|tara:strand:+ start:5149 stop:5643 length:495 start_codon:yes stop_codon:yes gene_type:complete
MNIPIGTLVEENISLKGTDIKQKISTLLEQGFTGYLVLTVEGRSGIEEGLLLLKNGLAVGAIYEYVKFAKSFYGDHAFEQLFNSSLAEFGVMDIGSLSKQQVELIIAFNEKIEFKKALEPKELEKLVPKKFDADVAEKALGKKFKKKESKFDVFKKLGLGGVSK